MIYNMTENLYSEEYNIKRLLDLPVIDSEVHLGKDPFATIKPIDADINIFKRQIPSLNIINA